MWLTKTSIGRKAVMAVTGIALVLFLTFHACMNVVSLFSAKGYNAICESLGANWYAVAATIVLGILILVHFAVAIRISVWNHQARPEKYAVTHKNDAIEWSSQHMLALGVIVLGGLFLHLYNFFGNMMLEEIIGGDKEMANNGIYHIISTFYGPKDCRVMGIFFTICYLIWFAALWFHLNHGIWSSMQSLGINNSQWMPRIRRISNIYSTVIILMFACVAVLYCLGYTPADINDVI